MSKGVHAVVVIFSTVIWIVVSRETVKPTKEVNWRKAITFKILFLLDEPSKD